MAFFVFPFWSLEKEDRYPAKYCIAEIGNLRTNKVYKRLNLRRRDVDHPIQVKFLAVHLRSVSFSFPNFI